jgi:hypothetical protein
MEANEVPIRYTKSTHTTESQHGRWVRFRKNRQVAAERQFAAVHEPKPKTERQEHEKEEVS